MAARWGAWQVRGAGTLADPKDPFAGVWDSEIVPLLESDKDGELQATTIFEYLNERYPGRFIPAQLRTLQRRIRDWRALYGPDKEAVLSLIDVG